MVDIYAKPEDREEISLYAQLIKRDHKPGPDGNLIEIHKITFGKKGTNNYQQIYEVGRLKRDNPVLWESVKATYERWLTNNTIVRDGLALESWPAITEGQIEACKDLGLHTVEDIATATSSIRQKLGIGANELVDKAKAFLANKDASATANRIVALEKTVADLTEQLNEARQTVDKVMAEKGKTPRKPRNPEPMEAAA